MLNLSLSPQFGRMAMLFRAVNSEVIITYEMSELIKFTQERALSQARQNVNRMVYDTPQPDHRERTHALYRSIVKHPIKAFTKTVRGGVKIDPQIIKSGGASHNGYYYAWIVEHGKKSGRGASRYPVRPFWRMTQKQMEKEYLIAGKLAARAMGASLRKGV